MLHHLHEHAIDLIHGVRIGDRRDFERERLERLALGVDDGAHGAQRRAETAVRECVVELRDFERRDIERAEQHRRQLRRLRSEAERDELARHLAAGRRRDRDRTVARFSDCASARTSGTGP